MKEAARLAGTGLLIGLAGTLLLAPFGDRAQPFLITLSVVQLVLYGIGIKRISDITNESRLFIYLVTPIIVFSIMIVLYLTIFGLQLFVRYLISLDEFISQLTVFFVFAVVVSIAVTILEIKGYRLLAEVTSVELFSTVANLLKWGLILSVVLVGLLLLMVANVLKIVGFFLVKD